MNQEPEERSEDQWQEVIRKAEEEFGPQERDELKLVHEIKDILLTPWKCYLGD